MDGAGVLVGRIELVIEALFFNEDGGSYEACILKVSLLEA